MALTKHYHLHRLADHRRGEPTETTEHVERSNASTARVVAPPPLIFAAGSGLGLALHAPFPPAWSPGHRGCSAACSPPPAPA